jgi:hypothetical protein
MRQSAGCAALKKNMRKYRYLDFLQASARGQRRFFAEEDCAIFRQRLLSRAPISRGRALDSACGAAGGNRPGIFMAAPISYVAEFTG